MPGRSLSSLLSCPWFSRISKRSWPRLAGLLGAICLAAAAHAQTAHFSYALQTLLSGLRAEGVAVDAAGNLYVGAFNQTAVFKVPSGCASLSCVTTVGGGFNSPVGVALDASGNLYVADFGQSLVLEVPPGCTSSSCVTPLGGGFNSPESVAVDSSGYVYVADTFNNVVKQMPPNCIPDLYYSGHCAVTTLGGVFSLPAAVAVDSSGYVYVANGLGSAPIAKLASTCTAVLYKSSSCGVALLGGDFLNTSGVALDSSGNIYVADRGNNAIKEVPSNCASSSCVTTLGSGFNSPMGVAVDGSGNVYVSDSGNQALKEIERFAVAVPATAVGQTTSITLTFTFDTGGIIGAPAVLTEGVAGLDFADAGTGTCTSLSQGNASPYSAGDTCTVQLNFSPRFAGLRRGAVQLKASGGATIATAFAYGTGTGPQAVFNAPLTLSTIGGGIIEPTSIAVDGLGNAYVGSYSPASIAEIPAGCTSASCVNLIEVNGLPAGTALDASGNVYFFDAAANTVDELPAGCTSSACVTTRFNGFNIYRTLPVPGLAVDGSGNIYVADGPNGGIVEIPAGCGSGFCVTMPGGIASFIEVTSLAVDGSGNVYAADYGASAIKEVPPGCTSSSCIKTLPGQFLTPTALAVDGSGSVYVGDGQALREIPAGCASSACVVTLGTGFHSPGGIALDGSGNLYIADTRGSAVEKLDRADAPSLSFATATTVGSTDSTDGPESVTLANIGNQPLSFPVPATGSNPSFPGGFLYDSASTCTQLGAGSGSAASLAAGASCTLGVDFLPTVPGPNSGSIVLTDNSLNLAYATQSIPVSGTGLAQIVAVTVSSSPSYYTYFIVDAEAYFSAQTFKWIVGSQHQLYSAPQFTDGGTQYTFSKWSDGTTSSSDNISVTANTPSTLTAYFSTAYQLTTSAGAGGMVTPASGSYYPANTAVPLTATPSAGYVFSGWTGPVANASSATTTVSMTGPETVSASFVPAAPSYDAAITVQYASTTLTYPGATNITVCIAPAKKITATGSVQILDGSTVLTTQPVQGGGCAYWYITPGLAAGTHPLSAVYSGDKNNPGGASAPTNIVVNPVPVNLGVACWNASFAYGANYQCTVSASSNAGSAQGSITYSVDGGAAVAVPISNGSAQLTVAKPLPGQHSVKIAYAQQTNYAAASAPTQSFTVNPAPVVVSLTPSSYHASASAGVTFQAAVSSWSAGAPDAVGSVSFYDGNTLLASVPVSAGGQASYSTKALSPGTQTITAAYSGTNYAPGSTSVTITLTP